MHELSQCQNDQKATAEPKRQKVTSVVGGLEEY